MQSVGGVSRYFLELTSNLTSQNLAQTKICAGIHLNSELKRAAVGSKTNIYLDKVFWRTPTTKILKTLSVNSGGVFL